MMRSLFAAVSGLRGHQTRMDVVGNNIANVNTIGFKSSRTTFADTLSQTTSAAGAPQDNIGGTNPKQIGLGANVASIDLLFTDGSPQTTGNNTDLAISGDGLFIMVSSSGTYYTRDGSFSFDADGNLVLPGSGLYVQGWMADDDGTLITSGSVGDITVSNTKSMEATESTIATYTGNLNASTNGYEIGSISVMYADGTSATTTNYSPTAVPAGTIVLNLSSGEQIIIDDSSTNPFVEGQGVENQALYTSTVASVTASDQLVDVTLSVPEGNGIWAVKTGTQASNEPFTIQNLTAGTFIPGSTTTLTGEIMGVETQSYNGQTLVQLTLTGAEINGNRYNNGSVTVYVGDNSYEVGNTFSGSLNIDSITARQGATVTLADGATTTIATDNNPPMTFTSTSDSFTRFGNANDGTINSIERTSTTQYSYNNRLVSSVTVNTTSGASLDGLPGSTYSTGSSTSFYPSTSTMFTVYDSLGAAHSIPVLLTKTSANNWNITLSGGGMTYTMTEDDGSTTTVNLNVSEELSFDATGAYTGGSANLTIRSTNGAEDMNVTINLAGITQYSGSNNVNASADGNAAGTIQSISFDTTGTIIGTYSNGLKRNEAQVALATFTNSAGLTKTSNSLYQESNNSGTPTISTVSDLGSTITPSALEMSNVDIANEFSDMIVTQRGFQSNSKMITVADEMLETLINMKR